MLWWLIKKLLFWGFLIAVAVFGVLHFSGQNKLDTEANFIKACTVDGKNSMCAAITLKEGQSLGLMAQVKGSTEPPTFVSSSKMIKQATDLDSANLELKPLYIDSEHVDLYGYVKKDIKEGDELVVAPA